MASNINESGLSGYAKYYAEALKRGLTDQLAHQYATTENKGSGLTMDYVNKAVKGTGGSHNLYIDPLTGQVANQYEGELYGEAFANAQKPPDLDEIYKQIAGMLPKYEAPPTLSHSEAQARAAGELNPLYGETLKRALQQVDESNIRRGFFGQLPGAALSRSTAADIETRKAQAIGQLTNQLVGQSEEAARAQQALAMQQRGQEANILLGALNQAQTQKQNQMQNILAMMGLKRQTQQDQTAADQWAQQFGLQTDQFRLQQAQWAADPRSQDWHLPTYQKKLNAEIAAINRSNIPSSGGSSDKTSATATNQAIAQAMTYKTYEEAMAALQQYAPTMAAKGVDVSKVVNAINYRFGKPDNSGGSAYGLLN